MMRGAADCRSLRGWMRVRRVGPNGYVVRDGSRRAIGFAKQTGAGEFRIGDFLQTLSECLTETVLWIRIIQRLVHLAPRFFGGPETSIRQNSFDVFTGVSSDGDFKIV